MRATRKHRKRLALLVVGILFGSVASLSGPERVWFPFFSWALFTRVPDQVTDFSVRLGKEPVEPLLSQLSPSRAAGLYSLIQETGQDRGRLPQLVHGLRVLGSSAPVTLVQRHYRPLQWWSGTEPRITEWEGHE